MKNNDYNMNDEPNLPLDNDGKEPFGLPSDYFSKFEDKLRKRLESENELSEFPVLSSIQKTGIFRTPENYFNSLEQGLKFKTELDSYPALKEVKKPLFSDLDKDYKKHLEACLHYKIELAEELKAYKTLYFIDKVNSFHVPSDYFEDVTVHVKEKIYQEKPTRISVLDKIADVIFGKTMAFSFGLAFIVGLAFYFNKASETIAESGDCKTLACLERQEILNSSQVISNLDDEQLMDLVDVNSLNEQLNVKKVKTNSSVNKALHADSITEDDLLDEL